MANGIRFNRFGSEMAVGAGAKTRAKNARAA